MIGYFFEGYGTITSITASDSSCFSVALRLMIGVRGERAFLLRSLAGPATRKFPACEEMRLGVQKHHLGQKMRVPRM